MKRLNQWQGLRRIVMGASAGALALSGVALAVPSASAATANTLSGIIYGSNGLGDDEASTDVQARSTAADPDAFLDTDGYYYKNLPAGENGDSNAGPAGSYSVVLAPGTYRVEFSDDLTGDPTGEDYLTVVTISDADVHLSPHMETAMECTTPGTQTGTPQVGQVLTAVPGTFSRDALSLGYTWYRYDATTVSNPDIGGYTRIPGATNSTYAVTPADQGFQLEVDVAGRSQYGNATCDWTNTSVVTVAASSAPAPAPAPKTFTFGSVGKPAGKAKAGKMLAAPTLSLPAGARESYQWFRVSKVRGHSRTVTKAISGAHGSKYRAKKKDKRSKLFVRILVSAPGYNTATVLSRRVAVH